MGQPGLTLLRRVGQINPESLDEYRSSGGFQALHRAFNMGPVAVVREMIESKLVGRGGAAFPWARSGNRFSTLPCHVI